MGNGVKYPSILSLLVWGHSNVCATPLLLKVWSRAQRHPHRWQLVSRADSWAPPQTSVSESAYFSGSHEICVLLKVWKALSFAVSKFSLGLKAWLPIEFAFSIPYLYGFLHFHVSLSLPPLLPGTPSQVNYVVSGSAPAGTNLRRMDSLEQNNGSPAKPSRPLPSWASEMGRKLVFSS